MCHRTQHPVERAGEEAAKESNSRHSVEWAANDGKDGGTTTASPLSKAEYALRALSEREILSQRVEKAGTPRESCATTASSPGQGESAFDAVFSERAIEWQVKVVNYSDERVAFQITGGDDFKKGTTEIDEFLFSPHDDAAEKWNLLDCLVKVDPQGRFEVPSVKYSNEGLPLEEENVGTIELVKQIQSPVMRVAFCRFDERSPDDAATQDDTSPPTGTVPVAELWTDWEEGFDKEEKERLQEDKRPVTQSGRMGGGKSNSEQQ